MESVILQIRFKSLSVYVISLSKDIPDNAILTYEYMIKLIRESLEKLIYYIMGISWCSLNDFSRKCHWAWTSTYQWNTRRDLYLSIGTTKHLVYTP
jgi:hypothetical protein